MKLVFWTKTAALLCLGICFVVKEFCIFTSSKKINSDLLWGISLRTSKMMVAIVRRKTTLEQDQQDKIKLVSQLIERLRPTVWIQSLANFYTEHFNWIEKTKNKLKRLVIAHFATNLVYVSSLDRVRTIHLLVANSSKITTVMTWLLRVKVLRRL